MKCQEQVLLNSKCWKIVNEMSKYIGIYFNIVGQEKIIGIVFLKLVI